MFARHPAAIAFSLGVVYFTTYSILSVLRHRSYHSLGFDLGLFEQIFWNTAHGRPFESTMSQAMATPHSFLGDHFSPALLLVLPFYLIYPHAETLLVAQTLLLTLGAIPIYLLARLKLPAWYAPLWVAVYFLYLPLAYINLFDFHEIALSVLPLGFALYFLERERLALFLLCLALTFLVKEEMALVGAGFGAYVLLGKRNWILGFGIGVASLLAFALIIQIVIPYFAGGVSYPYISDRYVEVGGSPVGILKTLVTDPLRIARAILVPNKILFMISIFGPVLALSAFAGWAAVVLLPTLSYLLLSNYAPMDSFTSQYSAPLIPLVIGTAVLAIARLRGSAQPAMAAAVLVASLLIAWTFGDLPFSRKFDPGQFQTSDRYIAFTPQLAQIPAGARVCSEGGLTAQLSDRQYIYDYKLEGTKDAQWLVLDYAATGYDLSAFQAQLSAAKADGYVEIASGKGLALLSASSASGSP